ncbi:MAG: M15 family metallopeptidase [Eubacterium sp.]|nr:M15 family metallopeptidase [Eubacterium sp.]
MKLKKLLTLCLCITAIVFVAGCTKGEDKKEVNIKVDSNNPYYYCEENSDRYESYQQKNPDMDFDEVIWRVEADIDKPSYEEMTEVSREEENSLTVLVNKHFVLRSDYEPAQLVELGGGYLVTPETKAAFGAMKEAAQEDGINLMYTSAYRSLDRQEILYNNYVAQDGQENADTYSARPGSSEHHTGRAIDLVDETWDLMQFEYSDQCKWVRDNCWKYGFILRYGEDIVDVTGYMYESWHITYVGKEAAKIMHDEGIEALEEYWVKYVKYSPEK